MPSRDLAVMTGDFVGSTRAGPPALEAAMAVLAAASAEAACWTGADARFTRFRGDGWQALAPAPHLALRTALFLRARLRGSGGGLDSRISIGIGPGALPTGSGLAAGSGPAFERSGHGLDIMPRAARFALSPADAAASAIIALSDEISRRWTRRQGEVFVGALVPAPEVQAAQGDRLGVSQQMIAKHLKAGGDWALRAALASFEAGASDAA